MNKKIIPRLIATGLVAALAIGGFVWLYQHSVSIDAAKQQRILAVSEQIKQLDARWNVDVLRSATGLNNDYDPLIGPLTEWPKLRERLNWELFAVRTDRVDAELKRIDELFAQKAQGINDFKARNAVLRNSIQYLPTGQAEIGNIITLERDRTVKSSRSVALITGKLDRALQALSTVSSADTKSSNADARIAMLDLRGGLQGAARDSASMQNAFAMTATDSAISALVSSALRYNLSPAEALATELRDQNTAVKESLPALAPALREVVRILTTHIDVVLRERTSVTALLSRVNAVPIAASVDKLVAAVSDGFARHISEQDQYTKLFQVYVVLLLAFLLVIATLLVRQWMQMSGKVKSSEAQLDAAELKLISADRLATVGELSESLAHEINTPLGAALNDLAVMHKVYAHKILPYVEACQRLSTTAWPIDDPHSPQWAEAIALGSAFDAEDKQDFADCLEDSITSLGHINEVVINIGEFSRVGQGTISSTNVEKSIAVVLKMLSSAILGRSIIVETRFAPTPSIQCNVASLHQGLINILKNAIESMPRGGKVVVETGMHGTDSVFIAIADTGTGMSPEVQARIFERHFTTKSAGSGVGLAITKKFVEDHGGELAVRSTEGEGTKFAMSLPIKMVKLARSAIDGDQGLGVGNA